MSSGGVLFQIEKFEANDKAKKILGRDLTDSDYDFIVEQLQTECNYGEVITRAIVMIKKDE